MFNLLKFISFGLMLFVFQFKAFCMKDIQQTVTQTKSKAEQLLDSFSMTMSLKEKEIVFLKESLEIEEKEIAFLEESLERKEKHIVQLLSLVDAHCTLAKRNQKKEDLLMFLLENICNPPQIIL